MKILIALNFFAPHNGWTICDSHFGQGKAKLRRDFSLDLIRNINDISSVFKELQNTTVEIISKLPIPKEQFKPQTGKMSDRYYWEFQGNGSGKCKTNFLSDVEINVDIKR
jgi:hypothetical protein